MFDRTYQPGVSTAPVGVAEGECDRVQVWRSGFGWVDRPAAPEPVEVVPNPTVRQCVDELAARMAPGVDPATVEWAYRGERAG